MPKSQKSQLGNQCLGSGLLALDVVYPLDPGTEAFVSIGGSCGNVLSILNAFGIDAKPIGQLGRDAAGKILVNAFRQRGIDTRYLNLTKGTGTPIIVQTLSTDYNGDNKHAFSFRCPETGIMLPRFRPIALARAREITPSFQHVDVYYSDRLAPSTQLLAEVSRKRGALVFLEPSERITRSKFLRIAKLAHVLKVSNEIIARNDDILDSVWNPLQVITAGANGLWYRIGSRPNIFGPWHRLPAVTVKQVVDPAGSGDWVSAGIIISLLSEDWQKVIRNKSKISEAIRTGQRLAAENCKWVGAQGFLYSKKFQELAHAITGKFSAIQKREDILLGEALVSYLKKRPIDFTVPCA